MEIELDEWIDRELIRREKIRMEYKKINLGCGNKKMKGFLNVDVAPEVEPDQIVDLEKPLPFPDNYFDHIFSEHTLEHVRPEYFKQLLNEIYRIAKPDCILELILPFDNIRNRTCTDHYRTFGFRSFWEYIVGTENSEDRSYFGDLKLVKISKDPNKFYRILIQMYPFLCNEVYLKFKIFKYVDDHTLINKRRGENDV